MSGRIYLVGAGPGDPGLLTRRGERCLAVADVVVHDRLVGSRLLDLVRPGAEVIALGRSHDDRDRPSQAAIEALLVERARAGKTVVRLKNGDPFLLGRGAEEAEALRRADVPFVERTTARGISRYGNHCSRSGAISGSSARNAWGERMPR